MRRYVSSQLETVVSSKLGPLKLPSNQRPEREAQQQQQQQQQQSPGRQQSKPRSSSADNVRSSGSREGGERASKKFRDKEALHGTDRDKLQSIYSAAPRTKHQSVWTKENLLRGGKKAQEAERESVKETRASVSHDIRQVPLSACFPAIHTNARLQLASISSMLASAAPVELRRGPLPPTLDPRQPKSQNLRKSLEFQPPAVSHALFVQPNSNSNAGGSAANPMKAHSVGQQHHDHQQHDADSRSFPAKTFHDPRSDANLAAVRERLAALSQTFAAANSNASNMSNQVSALDRAEKQRKPQKPAPNAVPLGRLRAEGSVGSLGSSVKGDDDWDEPDTGLLTLENFNQSGSTEGVILNSPRSIEVSACAIAS